MDFENVREMLDDYILFLKKGIKFWLEYHFKLFKLIVITMCIVWSDILLFGMISLFFDKSVVTFIGIMFCLFLISIMFYFLFKDSMRD